MTQTLPSTLHRYGRPLDSETRQVLLSLSRDGRARIVYGLQDSAYGLPHSGVLLAGRAVAGWIISIGRENNSAEDVGDLLRENVESFVPSRLIPRLVEMFDGAFRTDLRQLCRTQVFLEARGDEMPREVSRATWDGYTCGDLVGALGMIEVVNLGNLPSIKPSRHRDLHARVLVPKERSVEWEAVPLVTALSRAEHERRVPAFWTFYKRRTTYRPSADAGIVLELETVSDTLPKTDGTPSPHYVTCLTAISGTHDHPRAGKIVVKANRRYDDGRWSLQLDSPTDKQYVHYDVIDGAVALQLVELAFLQGTLPASSTTFDDCAASSATFDAALAAVHERQRELKFVCEALGLERAASST